MIARQEWISFHGSGWVEKRRVRLPKSGLEIALLDWGGEGPPALLHHANGFCAGTLGLVAERLRPHFRVIGMDARGHGDSARPEGPEAYAWARFAEDLLGVAEILVAEHGSERMGLGLGHSFGGTALLGAASLRPDLFDRIVLVDPVVPPPLETASDDPERAERLTSMVEAARRRRSVWPDRAAAREHFSTRSLFANWLPEALDLYVEHGLRDRSDGQVELKCPGEIEATIFSSSRGLDIFDLARRATTPALFLWAVRGDFPRFVYEAVVGAMADATIVDVDAGHLVPMERPELVVEVVAPSRL